MTYTIWMCCGQFEHEDTEEEAICYAAAIMGGDNHQVLAVEGPNGEDLMAQVEARDRENTKRWIQQSRDTRSQFIGSIEVKGPTGKWWGRESCYSEESRDKEIAEMIRIYGSERVRFVKAKEG